MKFAFKGVSTPTLIAGVLLLSGGFILGIYSGGANATLGATLIGGLLGISGGLFANYFSFLNEREKWRNQSEENEKKRLREEEASSKKRVEEIYTNALFHLAIVIEENENKKKGGDTDCDSMSEREVEARSEVSRWANILIFNLPNDVSYYDEMMFRRQLDSGNYNEHLRENIISIAERDSRSGFPSRGSHAPTNPNSKEFIFEIDEGFVKENLVKGNIFPRKKTLNLSLNHLNDFQRQILVDAYYEDPQGLPSEMNLFVPIYNTKSRKIDRVIWKAKVWPTKGPAGVKINPIEAAFLQAWESDYKEALEISQQKLS